MKQIPIMKLREMSDSRWNELALKQAHMALVGRGVKPTPKAIKKYFNTLRNELEERWVAVEEVPVYAVPH